MTSFNADVNIDVIPCRTDTKIYLFIELYCNLLLISSLLQIGVCRLWKQEREGGGGGAQLGEKW